MLTRFATGNALKRMCVGFAGLGQIPDLLIGQRIRIHSPLTIRHLKAIHIACCKVSAYRGLYVSWALGMEVCVISGAKKYGVLCVKASLEPPNSMKSCA